VWDLVKICIVRADLKDEKEESSWDRQEELLIWALACTVLLSHGCSSFTPISHNSPSLGR